ncbi:gamma-glutamylaminecyclotransferase C-like [Myxocyprinus asiaticus]|uniref:gamma-glutamylaminecyclotransferase C-like n=1 Tax=Myxocyprinus asiaticus TaxID=70543 RepID=UPI002223D796|nr:gamma-glutamylaminecyclotransferase C-like [Myxocyprinus asiaticus]
MFKMTQVFVYGTLKSGQPNYYRMLDAANGKAKFLGRSRTVDSYPLVIATQYNIPFLLNVPGKGHCVRGEIYSVDEKMLKFLDWFECCPHQYQRTLVKLEVDEWVGEGENNPKAGSIIETFVYSTTTYKPEWLQNPTYENYDSYGDHGLEYVCREDRCPK